MGNKQTKKKHGEKWETETWKILKDIFPDDVILHQVTTSEVPHAKPDFAVINVGLIIECKAFGLTPCGPKTGRIELEKHKHRQELFKSIGFSYIWWAYKERQYLIKRTKKYLDNAFFKFRTGKTDNDLVDTGDEERLKRFLKEIRS